MNTKQLLIIGALTLEASLCGRAVAQEMQRSYVQVAEIEIDPAQLEDYKAAVREQIETAVRVKSLKLVQTTPIMLGAKAR